MNARLLPDAEAEAQATAQWYEDQQAGLGEQFLAAFVDGILQVERHPSRFPRVERLRVKREIRRCMLGRFPYSIVYEVRERDLLILAVAHAKRRPNYWRKRLGG